MRTIKEILESWLSPIAKNKEFFVFMYALGMTSAICTLIASAKQHLYANAWEETYLGVWIVCVFLSLCPLKLRRVLRGIIYAIIYPLSLIDVYCAVKFDSPINPSIMMLVGETDPREAGEFFSAYLSPDILFTNVGWIVLIAVVHILYTLFGKQMTTALAALFKGRKGNLSSIISGDTSRRHLKGISKAWRPVAGVVLIAAFFYTLTMSWENYRNLKVLMSQETIGDVEHKLTEKDCGVQYLPLYRLVFSVYSNRLAAKQVDVLREVAKKVEVDSCSYTSPEIVLIIGEAYNKYHSQLYGYEKPTTPHQLEMRDKGDLVSFDDVISPWNLTSYVFKHIMSTYTVGDKGDWCDYPLFGEIFRKSGYHVTFLTNEFLPKAKQQVFDFSGGFFLNDPELSKAQFDARNKDLHVFDDALLHDFRELQKDSTARKKSSGALNIFHLIGQHQDYRIRSPKSRHKFQPEDYDYRTELTNQKWKRNVAWYDNATLFNDSVVWAVTEMFKDKDAIIIYMPDHGEEVHSKELPHFNGRMHSTKIVKRLAREEFGIPFWIYGTKLYQQNHPLIWQQVKDAHTKKYMTDALPHLLMYLAGIHCKYYREELNILSPRYNEQRPRIIKHEEDYDKVMGL